MKKHCALFLAMVLGLLGFAASAFPVTVNVEGDSPILWGYYPTDMPNELAPGESHVVDFSREIYFSTTEGYTIETHTLIGTGYSEPVEIAPTPYYEGVYTFAFNRDRNFVCSFITKTTNKILNETYSANFANLLSDCDEKYNSGGNVANVPSITNQIFTISLSQGTNTNSVMRPRWYNTGTKGFGFFADNTMNIKLNGPGSITKITLTGASATYTVGLTASTGTVTKSSDNDLVWTGDASEVTLTGTGANRFTGFAIDYTAQLPISDAPVINPGSSTYVGPLSVTISAKEGATIYYTTDGTAPTTESTVFDGTPISFPSRWNSTTNPYQVKAIAVEPGNDPSIIVSASYAVLDGITCYSLADFNRRSFDMIPGTGDPSTLYQFNREYTVVYQNGPSIYITDGIDCLLLNASSASSYEPGDVIEGFSGTFYCAAPFTPQLNCTPGSLSDPVDHVNFEWPQIYDNHQIDKSTISQPYELMNTYIDYCEAETPEWCFRTARFEDGSEITIYNVFNNFLTFDKVVVLPQSPNYYNVKGFVGSITVNGSDIVCFVPIGITAADVEVASVPIIKPESGIYKDKVTVNIVVPNDTKVYYTTDDNAPNDKSTLYTEPFTLTRSAKVRAVAIAEGKFPSIIAESDYTVRVKSEAPEFSPAAGAYYNEVTVTLSAPDNDAYIYYTLDGTEPTYMSTVYLLPFTISETTTVKAIAVSFDQDPSDVITAKYIITQFDPEDSPANFRLAGKAMELGVNEEAVLTLSLGKADEINGFQTDISLPEGLSITQNSRGKLNVTLGEGTSLKSHTLTAQKVSGDNRYRILVYSSKSETFVSGEGLLNIPLVSDATFAGGEILIDRTELNFAADYTEKPADVRIPVSMLLYGDANDSGWVAIDDVVTETLYIMENDPQPFSFRKADVNRDSAISIADVMKTVAIVLNNAAASQVMSAAAAPARVSREGEVPMSLSDVTFIDGKAVLTISLGNVDDITALQGNLILPEGVSVTDITLADAQEDRDHNVDYLEHNPTTVSFAVYSLSLDTLEPDVPLLDVELSCSDTFAGGTIQLNRIMLTDTKAQSQTYSVGPEVTVPDPSISTGIGAVSADSIEGGDVYNLQGMLLMRNATRAAIRTLAPGLYIIAGHKVMIK